MTSLPLNRRKKGKKQPSGAQRALPLQTDELFVTGLFGRAEDLSNELVYQLLERRDGFLRFVPHGLLPKFL